MTRITFGADLSCVFDHLTEVAEICDTSGRVLGRFVPTVNLEGWEPTSAGITEEELARRLRSDEKRYTTAELLARLQKL